MIFVDFHAIVHTRATREYFSMISFAKERARALLFPMYKHLLCPETDSQDNIRMKSDHFAEFWIVLPLQTTLS